MRIAFITYEFPPDTGKGGIGTYTSQVAAMLAKAGCEVHVFAGSQCRQEKSRENSVNIHWVKCSGPHEFQNKVVSPFAKEHRDLAFDLIESPEIHGNAAGIKQAFPQLPMVVRLHAPDWLVEHAKKKYVPVSAKLRFVAGALRRGRIDFGYWRRYRPENDADRAFAQMADGITAPSLVMKNWAVKHWQVCPKAIEVIPNPFTPPQGFAQLPVSGKGEEIVFFGRLNVLKGLVNATLAMKRILKENPSCRFRIIGDDGPGPHQGRTMRQWMQQQLKRYPFQIEFSDGLPYEALPRAIGDAGIVLLPSLFESFSYTCAEAMASGKAVIGSKGTGMEDMIRQEMNGILVDANRPREIYRAVNRLIEDKELRLRLSAAARESISAQFSAERTMRHYLDYYRNLIQEN